MAVGYSKVFNARYLVTQCSRLFRGNSVLLPSFLLSFSLFFFADDTDHDTLATNLVHPSLPSLSPVSRVSYATEEAIVGSSAMFRYLIPEHFFSETGVFQKRHSSSSSSSCHCSARGSFTKLRLCSVTLSAAQTCPPGESTASSLNFIKKKKNGTKKKKKRKRGGKREEERQKWK